MKRILLVNSVVREFAPPNNVPLGLLYIAAVLEQHGHHVDICDMNALRTINPDREYWLEQYRRPYDFIGLSGLIVTYQEQRRYLDYIMANYAAFGKPVLISGGGLATGSPDFVLRNMPELDCLVIGEGEAVMYDIVNGAPFSATTIPGVYTGGLPAVSQTLIKDLDWLPFPAWDKVPIEIYLKNPIWGGDAGNSSKINYASKRSINAIVSRGCPYNCNFCASSIMGKKYRMRSVGNVIAEIKELKERYGIDFCGFVDDNTCFDNDWITEFCEALLSSGLDVHWGGSARVDALNPDLLSLMEKSNCEFLGFGFESASPEILKNMNKKADPEQAAEAIRMTREAEIFANGTFIVGYPGENKETLRTTAEFMRDNSCLNSVFHIQPYPQTALYAQVKDKIIDKYGDEDNYIKSLSDGTEFRVNLTDDLSDFELEEYRQKMMRGEPF